MFATSTYIALCPCCCLCKLRLNCNYIRCQFLWSAWKYKKSKYKTMGKSKGLKELITRIASTLPICKKCIYRQCHQLKTKGVTSWVGTAYLSGVHPQCIGRFVFLYLYFMDCCLSFCLFFLITKLRIAVNNMKIHQTWKKYQTFKAAKNKALIHDHDCTRLLVLQRKYFPRRIWLFKVKIHMIKMFIRATFQENMSHHWF
jgi:hypothetical protein